MNRKIFGTALCLVLLAVLVWLPVEARAESTMTSSDAAVDFIKTYEGFAPKPIWDYAQWTVGYGTKCPDDKLAYYQTYGITEAEAEVLFREYLVSFEKQVNGFADTYGLTFSQQQFDALVSFTFNCGGSWIRETNGNFHKAVASGDTGNAFIYAITLWSKAGDEYILINRRVSEANMYINGSYENDVYPDNYRWVFLDANGGAVQYKIFGFDANVPQPLNVEFTAIPNDEDGNPCTFGGWYTVTGTKVENLNAALVKGETLSARWLDKDGNVVLAPTAAPDNTVRITVTGTGVNIRSGPGTDYSVVGKADKGDVLAITEVVEGDPYDWGKTEKGWVALEFTNYAQVKQGGWVQEGTKWVYYQNGRKITNDWVLDSIGWCYLGADGYMVTNGWAKDSKGWCYLGADGYMVTNGWAEDSVGWCYLGANGYIVTARWLLDDIGWRYVDADGYMVADSWLRDSVDWCYLGADGYMVTNGWAKDSAGWCYLGPDGYMLRNEWQQDNGWYYLNADGYMLTGRHLINGRYYNFLPSGLWDGR